MAEIASTQPPRSPVRGTGVIHFRIYGMTRDGVKYALPPDVTPTPGECIVPGCPCGGPAR